MRIGDSSSVVKSRQTAKWPFFSGKAANFAGKTRNDKDKQTIGSHYARQIIQYRIRGNKLCQRERIQDHAYRKVLHERSFRIQL